MQVEAPTRRRAARRLMAHDGDELMAHNDIMLEGEFSVNPHDHGASRTLMALWPTETPPAQNVSAYWTALLAELEEKILVWDHAGVNQLVAASAPPPPTAYFFLTNPRPPPRRSLMISCTYIRSVHGGGAALLVQLDGDPGVHGHAQPSTLNPKP